MQRSEPTGGQYRHFLGDYLSRLTPEQFTEREALFALMTDPELEVKGLVVKMSLPLFGSAMEIEIPIRREEILVDLLADKLYVSEREGRQGHIALLSGERPYLFVSVYGRDHIDGICFQRHVAGPFPISPELFKRMHKEDRFAMSAPHGRLNGRYVLRSESRTGD